MTDQSSVRRIAPFDGQPGEWLRCAFHVHTSRSDGWLQPNIQLWIALHQLGARMRRAAAVVDDRVSR